jgi:hypothetical protein
MTMKENVILNAGTTVEHQLTSGAWALIPDVTVLGAVGEQAEAKEKTTLSDRIKKYGSGLRDAPDRNLQGNYIPFQEVGDEHYAEYLLQQDFITRCRNEEEFNMRVNWSDDEVTGFLFKSLGFQFNDGNQEAWKMWTVNGKQNSRVIYNATVTGTATVATAATTQLNATPTPSSVVDFGEVIWASSDVSKATVDTAGLVTGVAAGTVIITAEIRGVIGSLEVTVS